MLKKTTPRRLLLKKYYRFDSQKNEVDIDLHFKAFSELVDNNFGDDNVEKLSNKLFSAIENAFEEINAKFKFNLIVSIKDYENYNEDEIEKIITENIALKYLNFKRKSKQMLVTSILMTITGAMIIFASSKIPSLTLLASEIVNIAGTLLVWEAASLFFIDRFSSNVSARKYFQKLVSITVKKEGEKNKPKIMIGKQIQKLIEVKNENVNKENN